MNKLKIIFTSSRIPDGNMSFRRGNPDEALQNRINFFKKNKLNYDRYVGMAPTHTIGIKTVSLFDQEKMINETDGIITNDKNITLFTLTGDCIPLSLVDPDKNIFALIHISWKNAGLGILTEAISTFIFNFHSSPTNLIAKIGPSIGPCCYTQENPQQLKDPKWKPFIQLLPSTSHPLPPTYSIDLWSYAEKELEILGLKKPNIDNPKVCTFHTNKHFSHHKTVKEKLADDFRFGTLLALK